MKSERLRILVVDDEEAHIEAIRRAFEGSAQGADIDAVGTLKDYRDYIAAHLPDLVLIDLNLPDGRAVEVLKYPPEEAPFPILVMTAFGSQQIVVEVMKAGALDYVVKSPEAFFLLPRTVERALHAWQLILKHKQSEVALRESEARYRNLYESMMDAFARVSMDGRILEFNQAYQAMLGYSGEQLKQLTYMELTPVRWHAVEAKMIQDQVLTRGYSDVYEKEYRKQDGTVFPVELRTFLVHDAAGQPASMWAIVRDITERKRVEESHARLVTAVEQAAETIVITDAKGTILYANPAFERTTGYPREEVLGQNPRILKSGKHDAEFYRQMWAVLAAGKVWSGRLVNKRKDGTLFEEDASISPMFDTAGKIVNYVGVKRDVTRETQLEQQFLQAQKMEAIGRLAGGVAHDFNNMLSVILMNASLLKADEAITTEQAEGLNEIALAAERGANLTRQLLAFSRRQVMQARALDINDVVVGITKMLQRLIGEDIALQTRLMPGSVMVWGDAGMIEQVLLNLAVNARDAMPEGGRLSIEVDCVAVDEAVATRLKVKAGEFVRLTVRDEGSGIAPEHLQHIFEPFYTTKAAGAGTGLGLATVHGIVEQHHGWVAVESPKGQGAAFLVHLPRLSARHQETVVDQTAVRLRGGQETILLVEDEHELKTLILRILEHHGYRVLQASSGVEAAEVWRKHGGAVDLLLTDIIMPGGLSGGKLAEQLQCEKPGLKVIFMSGYPGEVVGRGLDLHESRNFLQKPFPSAKLIQAVRECLDKV